MYLCQRKYALEIISETGLMGAKLASTTIESNHQLAKDIGPLFEQPNRYCRFIRKLIYLTLTLLELAYVVHILAVYA